MRYLNLFGVFIVLFCGLAWAANIPSSSTSTEITEEVTDLDTATSETESIDQTELLHETEQSTDEIEKSAKLNARYSKDSIAFVPLSSDASSSTTENPKQGSADNENKEITEDAEYWKKIGMNQLKKVVNMSKKLKDSSYQKKAKNIIIFVGDGMGLTTITAGRIYKGQTVHHNNGEEEMLSFDEFPFVGLSKTYNVDKQVPDSAGTATAMFSGIKTNYGAIGVDATSTKTDGKKGTLTSIMDWAQEVGKRTGIVTTTRITHATPAATFARIHHRDWECDNKVPTESKEHFIDIARQLVEKAPGNKFNVILGGGLSPMGAINVNETRSEFTGSFEDVCQRTDNRNLVEDWLKLADDKDKRVFVQTRDDLLKVDTDKVEHLMGLFRNNHITYAISKQKGEPSLKEMTETAIKILDRGQQSKGFVLMVEGGRIDQAHHQNYAHAAMQEVLEFDMAIEAAHTLTNPEETLILVTADHSHSVTLNGYPKRGNDILGFANKTSSGLVYETITYANGPGYYFHLANNTQSTTVWRPLENFTKEERSSTTYRHMATFPLKDETHGGEDVIVFATGPGANLVRGVFEQNYLAYIMSYAGCMGPAKDFDESCAHLRNSAGTKSFSTVLILTTILSLFLVKI